MKKIELEAHFLTEEYIEYFRARKEFPKMEVVEDENHRKFYRMWFRPGLCQSRGFALIDKLFDLGEGRIKEMEADGIDMQALSLADPGCEQFEAPEATALAKKTNDDLYQAIKKHPDRFIGLAALAPQDPSAAADELERAVSELGFGGAKINSNIRGEYLDDQKYWPILERAERLSAPINIHPTMPSASMAGAYADYGFSLAGASLGFAAETALHAMRLIYAGAFDKYPGLKIILGHLGEGLPFWGNRLNLSALMPVTPGEPRPKCLKKPSEYIKTNFIATTSGMFSLPAFLCVYLALGADNMAFAHDYPFEGGKPAGQFMEDLPISDIDKEKICHLTAERLFKLDS